MQPDLITISREYGAGGSELASLLGATLGWRVLDSDIPVAVAKRLGIRPDSPEHWDEHAPGLLENIGNSFMLGSPDLLIDPALVGRPDARDVAAATRDLLLEAVATPPLIVVGHGAQVIFSDRPRSLHVRLIAPIAHRIPRIVARGSCAAKEATAVCQYVDRDRAQYVQDYLGRDVRDPLLYAVQINTGVVAMSEAVALVLKLVGADAD
jgi:cytidylate kinase